MSFGGSAAAANAAIKRNAALRSRRAFLNGVQVAYRSTRGVRQTASSDVRKRFSEALAREVARDRRRTVIIALITILLVAGGMLQFFG